MKKQRFYNYKDVYMLMACKTIMKSLQDHLTDLSKVRTNWTQAYVDSATLRIDETIEQNLGIDKQKELRLASALLASIQGPAKEDLSLMKTQIEIDFGDEATEILIELGFTRFLNLVQKNDQEATIQLLYAFKTNMTDQLKNKMVGFGTNVELIDRIIGYADQLKNANVTQESLKETTKELSEDNLDLFNDIYTEVIGICKIASKYYHNNPLLKEAFTFSKVVANMGTTRNIEKEGDDIVN